MRKWIKRIVPILLLVCTVSLLPVQASAAGKIDTGKDVKLTIEYRDGEADVSGVAFDLYRVADMSGDAAFSPTADFRGYPVELNGLDTVSMKSLAETLAAYADRDQLKPTDSGNTDRNGNLYFPSNQVSLKPGLYLVIGRRLVTEGYTYSTEPFLVSLPSSETENGEWSYAVIATPKYTKTENPPSPSDRTVTRKVLKVWKGDIEAFRPAKVEIQLLRDGVVYDTQVLSSANNWQYTWEKLPEYTEDGAKISWQVVEKEVSSSDYTVLVSAEGAAFVITNTYAPEEPDGETISRTVQKIWNDKGYENKRSESVTVSLLKNGETYDTQHLDETNSWKYAWTDLPKYDDNGREISWSIKEKGVSGYTASVEQNGYTFILTNSYDKPKLPQTGLLWWPVPLLAAGGILFIGIGISIKKRKKDD